MSEGTKSNWSDTLFNLVLVAVLLSILLMPGGWLRERMAEWLEARETRALIDDRWEDLVTSTSRIDVAGESVQLVEFADYECPYCRELSSTLAHLSAKHPHVGIVYRHFPLEDIHPLAADAAAAAVCAERQGRFRAMHYRLFELEGNEEPDWRGLAMESGVPDLTAFDRCLVSEATQDRLRKDRELAEELGVTATPTLVHKNGIVLGSVPLSQLEDIIVESEDVR